MTTPTAQPSDNNKHRHHGKQQHGNKDRRPQQQQPQMRRSATEIVAQPPRGYTASVHELDTDTTARKRMRLLVLASENGWKLLPFMSIRIDARAVTAGANISVLDDLDIIPANFIESAIEVNLISDDSLLALATLVAEFREKQKTIVPVHKRPFVQRPFEEKLSRIHIEEDDMTKKNNGHKAAHKTPPPPATKPRRTITVRDSWWLAAVC